jgi:hypothetical protein
VIRRLILIFVAVACWPVCGHAQAKELSALGAGSAPASSAIALDGSGHCTFDVANLGALTYHCAITVPTAGDLITVEFGNRDGNLSKVSDPTNGTYTTIFYVQDSANPTYAGMAYFCNAASGTYNVTVTLSVSEADGAYLSAEPWKNAATSSCLDSGSITQHQVSTSGTVANANCGTAASPAGNGELIMGYGAFDSDSSVTAGANFTLIDTTNLGNFSFPQYWIQTTATATNAPFTSAADDWISGCAAFKP